MYTRINNELFLTNTSNTNIPSWMYVFPLGSIIAWTSITPPNGWLLCDGTNNTPDLRNMFVLGTANASELHKTGGELTHTLIEEEMPSHTHTVTEDDGHEHDMLYDATCKMYTTGNSGDPKYQTVNAPWNVGNISITGGVQNAPDHNHTVNGTGLGKPHDNVPPYYVLCYIMKIIFGCCLGGSCQCVGKFKESV